MYTIRWKGKIVVSSREIEMHFAEIMHLAERIEMLAAALKSAAEDELTQIICKNRACWNSRCADILIGKEAQIGAGLLHEADKLYEIAGQMKRQAKRMYQAELACGQLAATRIYSQQSWK